MGHIAERFLIHFFSATALTLCAFFALRYWVGHNQKVGVWISARRSHLLVLSAVLVFALLPLREPFDVALGQTWYKAIADQISWFLGAAVSAWGLHRFGGDK